MRLAWQVVYNFSTSGDARWPLTALTETHSLRPVVKTGCLGGSSKTPAGYSGRILTEIPPLQHKIQEIHAQKPKVERKATFLLLNFMAIRPA
jgi:hypothetical protein